MLTSFQTLDQVSELCVYAHSAVEILRKEMKTDAAHDEGHIVRVLRHALKFGEGANLNVLVPAVILHDLFNVPKDSSLRSHASRYSAEKACILLKKKWLGTIKQEELDAIAHAIEAHSFSANIVPRTLEAKALQDADRIEALGHIGIARLFATGGGLGRQLFHFEDPLAHHRDLDENAYTLDHFMVKLVKLPHAMQTHVGKSTAFHHLNRMQKFIDGLVLEIKGE